MDFLIDILEFIMFVVKLMIMSVLGVFIVLMVFGITGNIITFLLGLLI